ncbi:putative Dynamin-related protein DNM1 [Glarea lozoyensis 74030]|uniref:dynamin GTPase n=1 Tax=Glarea lozoyensis (strain ATCC 74030 / MF5533) TaxID=1104152 RepID=H0ERQ5_GLAL7|nr:putative Dynamin-related protein DNM1 [Glarea lozoyensis 74030]
MAALGEDLLGIVNKLQDLVFNTIGNDSLDLPQIVVVGSQSSGKSSVLENIVGRDFLPRGSGIVTRRPLILQLINVPTEDEDSPEPHTGAAVPIGDQPTDIEKQTRNLISEYIAKPNSIILAVSPANVDIVNSEALKLARHVDPLGRRTIGVLTKIDLMDHGTNALDILSGRVYPLKLGFIGVVNRSQQDIQGNKSLAEALKSESDFFKHHPAYRNMANRCGTQFLAKSLNTTLMAHIRERLPDIKARLNTLMGQTQQELASYGDMHFNGTSTEISTKELCGGARIYYIFNSVFGNSLETIDPTTNLSALDIRTAIRNSTGPRPSLFVPELAFDLLVKPQIKLLEIPSQRCVELVYEELIKICHTCGSTELSRFPRLQAKLIEVVSDLLRERLGPASNYVESLISIQRAYINTNHPNFLGAAAAMSNVVTNKQDKERKKLLQDERERRERRRMKEVGSNGLDTPEEDEENGVEKVENLAVRKQLHKGTRSMSPAVRENGTLRQRLEAVRGEDEPFDLVISGSPEHLEALREAHGHHERKREALKETHGAAYDEFENVRAELEALGNELHMLTDHSVALDANFSKYGYSAHLRTYDDGSPAASSRSSSISGFHDPDHEKKDWEKERSNGTAIKIYNKLSKRLGAWSDKVFEFYPAVNIEHKVELLGLIQAFCFNWIYFEIDGMDLFSHAIRRNVTSAMLWSSVHLPFIMAYVLGAAALSKLVVAHDCADADPHDLTHFYEEKSEEHIPVGLRWFYCGGFAIALAGMAVISLCHIHKDSAKGIRILKRYRLINRCCVCIILLLLPLSEHLSSLQLVSIVTGLLVWVLLMELWGVSCPEDTWFGQEGGKCKYIAKCRISKRDLESAVKGGQVIKVEELKDRGEKGGMYEVA